ncbi:BTB and MATH domain-containing protein 36-like [Mytilus trossulus]|uniref:BTB and MATH domain-containing protein 36-like n=1 Tax=Mytilus trossulus TaxID=6551 RepID=UPI0030061747
MDQSRRAENYNQIQTVGIVNDVTSKEEEEEEEEEEDDSDEDLEEIKSDAENLASPFNEPNIVLVFDNRKLYLQKEHLIAVSPVFEAMFSSNFLEGSMKEIPLPDKKHSNFVHFLRYLCPGFADVLTEATVHHMLPLAEEYQTKDLKERIEKFLIKGVLSKSDSITSVQIIIKILEAEKYNLNGYLTGCIIVASRKQIQSLKKCSKFEEISQNTQLKIAFKRMEDIDNIYDKVIRDVQKTQDGQSSGKSKKKNNFQ